MNAITVDSDVLGGTPCFAGTRVPVKSLFDHLGGGQTVDAFLEQFPRVSREQALAVIHVAGDRLVQIEMASAR